MISVNRLQKRKSDFEVNEWVLDSGAFTEISRHGKYRTSVQEYANQIKRWKKCGRLMGAVSRDWMCEPHILEKTGMTVTDHQSLTIEQYDNLLSYQTGVHILPVLQGYRASEYVAHMHQYGDRLTKGMWVGVGSVCKRNSKPKEIEEIVKAIKTVRPDLRLHLFGVKVTALRSEVVRDLAYSSDSMAWSFSARRQGKDPNDYREAQRFTQRVEEMM